LRNFLTGLIVFALYGVGCLFLINTVFYEEIDAVNETASIENHAENLKTAKEKLSSKTKQSEYSPPKSNEPSPETELNIINTKAVENNLPIESTSNDYVAKTFSVYSKKGTTVITCDYYATIFKNTATVTIPYRCVNYGNQIKNILASDSTATLSIKGFYSPQENSNIGKKRADYIKKLLVSIGIDSSKITTNQVKQPIQFVNSKAQGGILMELNSDFTATTHAKLSSTSSIPTSQNVASIQKSLPKVFKSKKFIEGFKNQYFVGNNEFDSYLKSLNRHLKNYPYQKVNVTIFQKSNSDDKEKAYISQVNALNVQKMMAQKGISRKKVILIQSSKQEEESDTSSNYIFISVK
jgi:outer membrane protein OmpA-like peptidoglycan-associated protein